MKNIRTAWLKTLVYLAPIFLALGACISCSSSGSGCSGNSQTTSCGSGTTPTTQSDGSVKCCANGVSTC